MEASIMKTLTALVFGLGLGLLLLPSARAATLFVDDNTQVVSDDFSGNGIKGETGDGDINGDGILEPSEIAANDKNTNCTTDGNQDGLPDGDNDCQCSLTEAMLASHSKIQVDSCKPIPSDSAFDDVNIIELQANGTYKFILIDNMGDNTTATPGDVGNGPNALPKIPGDRGDIIEGNGSILERVGPCKATQSKATQNCSPRPMRLFETAGILYLRDMTVTNFDPDCIKTSCDTNDVGCVAIDKCFSGGFMYVAGGVADLDHVIAKDNQTNIDRPEKNGDRLGGAILIDDTETHLGIDVSIHNSILADNKSITGGGIASGPGNILSIDQTTIRGNQATTSYQCTVESSEDPIDPKRCNCDGKCTQILEGDTCADCNTLLATCTVSGSCNCNGRCNDQLEGDLCGDCNQVNVPFTGFGGGIAAAINTMTVTESSLHDNLAEIEGGGIAILDFMDNGNKDSIGAAGSTIDMINTTVARNNAEFGAGISFFAFPPLVTPLGDFGSSFNISSSTIADNGDTTTELGGGIYKIFDTVPMNLRNTIVADNAADDGPDGHGLFTSEGFNHVGNSLGFIMSPISGDVFDQPAGLDAWVDDDPTDVTTAGKGHFPLLPTSLNVNSAGGVNCPAIDQIQVNRDEDLNGLVEFGECSKGAIEFDPAPVCGDGKIWKGHESCDDGTMCSDFAPCDTDADCAGVGDAVCKPRDGDGCSANCTLESCGNGVLDKDEECDDGQMCDDGTPCKSLAECANIGSGACTPRNGDGCSTACIKEFCGDGIVQTGLGEACDDGPDNGADGKCASDCSIVTTPTAVAICGNGVVEPGEDCDDGEAHNSDTLPDACRTNCTLDACTQVHKDEAAAAESGHLQDFVDKYDVDLDLTTLHGNGRSRMPEFKDCALIFSCGGATCGKNSVGLTSSAPAAGCSLIR
jgi:hypothetical protein